MKLLNEFGFGVILSDALPSSDNSVRFDCHELEDVFKIMTVAIKCGLSVTVFSLEGLKGYVGEEDRNA